MSKAVSKSVSMSEERWAMVEDRAPKTPGRDRSGYIGNLVDDDLRAAGVIGESSEVAKLTAKVAEAVRKDRGVIPHVEAALNRSTRKRMSAAA